VGTDPTAYAAFRSHRRRGYRPKAYELSHRLRAPAHVGSEERNFDALDFYECLRAFRRVIEPDGFRVLSQGARPNVHPSDMSSQASAWTSYVLTLGQPALTKDLVGTFDPVEDIASVGTVEEQDEFIKRHRAEQKRSRSQE
jgi:hypothetical protein